MKQTFFSLIFIALATITCCSCSDDDHNDGLVPMETKAAFDTKYPSASRVSWENEGVYYVAEFHGNNTIESEAWFDATGSWYMTKHEIRFDQLPEAVQAAFRSGEYSTWRTDDIVMLEQAGMETVYIIEAEYQNQEIDLYYSVEGILIKAIADGGNNKYAPQEQLPNAIETFISEKYSGARILKMESEKGLVEVDIIHNKISKDVYFDLQYNWKYTTWDVRISALPAAVTAAIAADATYAGYRIDDAEYVESPDGDFYLIELEKGEREVTIRIDASGTILTSPNL